MNHKSVIEIKNENITKFKQYNEKTCNINKYENLKYNQKFITKVSNMEESYIRNYLDKIIYQNYIYKNISITKNLLYMLQILSNKCCYRYIMNTCFNNIDISNSKYIKKSYDEIKGIKDMYVIAPYITEIFIKYTFKRYISESKNIEIHDTNLESSIKYTLSDCKEHDCIFKIIGDNYTLTLTDCLIASYNRLKNFNLWTFAVIEDILNISLYHSHLHGIENIKYINNSTYRKLLKLIKKINLLAFAYIIDNSIINNMDITMCVYLGYINDMPIYFDLLLKDELTCIVTDNNTYKYIIKLLIGVLLYKKKHNIKINYISILNLYNAKYIKYDIIMFNDNNFDKFERILPSIRN